MLSKEDFAISDKTLCIRPMCIILVYNNEYSIRLSDMNTDNHVIRKQFEVTSKTFPIN